MSIDPSALTGKQARALARVWMVNVAAQLQRCAPRMFTPGTCLYVGASLVAFPYGAPELLAAGRELTILEIWPENVEYYRAHPQIKRAILGDVRYLDDLRLPHFDAVFWWHGPEHVKRDEVAGALAGLEALTDYIVCGCPYGLTVQREHEMKGNPYQEHLSGLMPEDFTAHGYTVDTFGAPGGWNTSNILAWKEIR